jgi:YVTN family beta-propeller protein
MRAHLKILLSAILLPMVVAAQSPQSGRLLALSRGDLTLSVVDPVTFKVLGKAPSGKQPHEVTATSDGRTAYISHYGLQTAEQHWNTLGVVDLVGFTELESVDLGFIGGVHGMATGGNSIYVTADANKAIVRYDPIAKKVDGLIGLGQNGTHMMLIAGDLKRMFTTNVGSGSISIIERPAVQTRYAPPLAGDWTVYSVKVGEPSEAYEGFDVSPDGRELWTGSPVGRIVIVDTISKTVVHTIESPELTGTNRIKFSPDGKLVLIARSSELAAASGQSNVVVFDAASRRKIKQIDSGGPSSGIVMQPDGTRAYVAAKDIVVIDLKTLQVIRHIDVGPKPDGLAWAVAP